MNLRLFMWLVYALWIVLVIYLTVAAFGTKRDTQPHLPQSLALTAAIAASFALPYVPFLGFVNFAPVGPALSAIGLALCVAGMALLIAARQHLGRNWSQTVSAKEGHELVMSGPYRVLRHPMYTGGLVAAIGSAIVAGGAFVFLLMLVGALCFWRVGAEDRLLTRQFPAAFPAYKQRTWAIIPYVW